MMLNFGEYQFVKAEDVHLLLDYRKAAAKELWRIFCSKTPEKTYNAARGKGRKMETLIVTRSGYAVVTFLTRKRIANKLGIIGGEEEIGQPLVTNLPGQKRGRGRPKKSDVPAQPIDATFKPDPD